MHIIPENFQEKRSRFQARLDPNQLEDYNFELNHLKLVPHNRFKEYNDQTEVTYSKIKGTLDRHVKEFQDHHQGLTSLDWSEESHEWWNNLNNYRTVTCHKIATDLQDLHRELKEELRHLPFDSFDDDLTHEGTLSTYLELVKQAENIVREQERTRATIIKPVFDFLKIPITNFDIGLGVWQLENN